MRDYQITGLNWMISLHDNGLSGILADEMGLGKTLQAISFIGYLKLVRKVDGRFLVIVPLTMILNWEQEFRQWCPSLKVVSLYGDGSLRRETINTILSVRPYSWDVCVTSYSTIRVKYSQRFLTTMRWYGLILDEGLCGSQHVSFKSARNLKSTHRLILSGTPVKNSQIRPLLSFLIPEDFDESIEDDSLGNNFLAVLKPICLRRLKDDVKHIKAYKEINVPVYLPTFQLNWYRQILMKNIDVIRGDDSSVKLPKLQSLFTQLSKCANHPYLFDGAEMGPPFVEGDHIVHKSGKMIVLDMLLAKLQQQNARVLLFSQSTEIIDIIEDYLHLRPAYSYVRLNEALQPFKRSNQIAEFEEPNSDKFIFLLPTRVGGFGELNKN